MSEKDDALGLASVARIAPQRLSPSAVEKELRRLHKENERLKAKNKRLKADNNRLQEALRSTTVSLCSAVDLLERGGKKAAASNKMFAQMLVDCKNSFERGLAALKGVP